MQNLKQLDAALENIDKAIELAPDYALAYSNRGGVLNEMKQFRLALESLEKAMLLNPPAYDLCKIYNNIGNAYMGCGHQGTAFAYYGKAAELSLDFAEVYGTVFNMVI